MNLLQALAATFLAAIWADAGEWWLAAFLLACAFVLGAAACAPEAR